MYAYLVAYGHERLSQTIRVVPLHAKHAEAAKARVEALFPDCHVIGVYEGHIGRNEALTRAHGSLPLYSGFTAPIRAMNEAALKRGLRALANASVAVA